MDVSQNSRPRITDLWWILTTGRSRRWDSKDGPTPERIETMGRRAETNDGFVL
jgi:hypothetical protein